MALVFNNIVGAILPVYFGYVLDDQDTIEGSNWALLGLAFLSGAGLLLSVYLVVYDITEGGLLSIPEGSKEMLEAKDENDGKNVPIKRLNEFEMEGLLSKSSEP